LNKKLTNILRTNVTLYFICLVLFALAAIPFDVRLAIGEGAAAVVLLIIARRRSRSAAARPREEARKAVSWKKRLLSLLDMRKAG